MLPFPCNASAFETQTNKLYAINLATGSYGQVGNKILPDAVNALGYHPSDNYLYAVAQKSTAQAYIIRIGQNSVSEIVPNSNISQSMSATNKPLYMTSGEIDGSGYYWLSYSDYDSNGAAQSYGQHWLKVDLTDRSKSTYGQVVDSGDASGAQTYITVADWAWITEYPDVLYAIGGHTISSSAMSYETKLLTFNLTSKAWTTLTTYLTLSGTGTSGTLGKASWGAMYTARDGNLYATENNSGAIFKFSVSSPSALGYSPVAVGPAGGTNDGARCQNIKDVSKKKKNVEDRSHSPPLARDRSTTRAKPKSLKAKGGIHSVQGEKEE